MEEIRHIYDPIYEVSYKREATKGIDGFTVKATGTDKQIALNEAGEMYTHAKDNTKVEIKND